MKVNSATSQQKEVQTKKLSKEDIQQKLEAKFGKKIGIEKPKAPKDKVEVSDSAKAKSDTKVIDKEEVVIGDIGKNDPTDGITQEKLKGILRTGAFGFSDKERET